jgi:putative endonuclease
VNFASILRRLLHPRSRPRPSNDGTRLGARGETVAARFLRRCGHRIINRNYRCALGEIDLITTDGDTIVFVEVKTRSDDTHADPHESIGAAKRSRLERAAKYFLASRRSSDFSCRFDVVSIVWRPGESPQIEYIPDAFEPRNPWV